MLTLWLMSRGYGIVERGLQYDEVAKPNVSHCQSTIAAYSQGVHNGWMRSTVILGIKIMRLPCRACTSPIEATYLMWIDCNAYTDDAEKLQEYVRQKTGLYVSSGHIYGEAGRTFLRMNLGTSRSLVEDGVQRLIAALRSL